MSRGARQRPQTASRLRRTWRGFRRWRHRRPFWGGVFVIVAGAEICALPLAPVTVMVAQGIAGVPSILMGVFLIALGLITWASPRQHTITGVLAVLVGLGALVMSNLGGFVFGSLLAFLGGGMMFAWRPTARVKKRRGRKAERESADESGADHRGGAPADASETDRPAHEGRAGGERTAHGDPPTRDDTFSRVR